MGLRLVHSRQVPCWPWSLRFLSEQPAVGEQCRECGRDVARPEAKAGEVPVCIYCALDSGLLPLEDEPLA